MNSQRRRIETSTNSNSILNDNQADEVILMLDETNKTNVHGLRYCFSIEPENTDANANGFWCVICNPSGLLIPGDFPESIGELGNDDDFSPYIWGLGCWTASNQAPFHYEFTPSTSRNCQKGASIFGYVVKEGISAGAVRIIQTMTCFTI